MLDISSVILIAKKAGNAILEIFNENTLDMRLKSDNSPVTNADILANQIIIDGLGSISDLPILTEESLIDYEQRKGWQEYWLVDPLDGTKNFIAKKGDFTVNIALIKKQQPIFGVVYLPINGDIYFAKKGSGAFKNYEPIFNDSTRKNLIGATSVFHETSKMSDFFKEHKISKIMSYGSSLKICKLAEGMIDVYPRLNGTKEWDTAASDVIASEAGCKLIDVQTNKPLVYNKPCLKNNHFIASRKDLNFINI
jgi:3'(2'), 5'-bisphosphate nucleotidase